MPTTARARAPEVARPATASSKKQHERAGLLPEAASAWPSAPPPRKGPQRPPSSKWSAANAAAAGEDGSRHHGEVSMEGFIKSHLSLILQPFADVVQQLDVKVQQLEGRLDQTTADVQGAQIQLRDTGKSVVDLKNGLGRLDASLSNVREAVDQNASKLEQVMRDQGRDIDNLQHVQEHVDRTGAQARLLEKRISDLEQALLSDKHKGGIASNLMGDLGILQRTSASLLKDVATLKSKQEEHHSLIYTSQQALTTSNARHDSQQAGHNKLALDIEQLAQGIAATQVGLDDTRNLQSGTNTFVNALRANLQKTSSDLMDLANNVEALRNKHEALSNGTDKLSGAVIDIQHEWREAAAERQAIERELDKLDKSLSATKQQGEADRDRLSTLAMEQHHTSEAVQRLDKSVEWCHAGFAGLQNGFADTGANGFTQTLPRLKESR